MVDVAIGRNADLSGLLLFSTKFCVERGEIQIGDPILTSRKKEFVFAPAKMLQGFGEPSPRPLYPLLPLAPPAPLDPLLPLAPPAP